GQTGLVNLFEALFVAALLEVVLVHHHADAQRAVVQRDGPYPAVRNGDGRDCPLFGSGKSSRVLPVSVDRYVLEGVVVVAVVQILVDSHPIASGAVYQIVEGQRLFFPRLFGGRHNRRYRASRSVEADLTDLETLVHSGPDLAGMFDQALVKLRTQHLIAVSVL